MDFAEIRDQLHEFGARFQPPPKWIGDLKNSLPSAGAVSPALRDIVLVRIYLSDVRTIDFKVSDVCNEQILARYRIVPPDGLWGKWGDIVPKILSRLMFESCAEALSQQNCPPASAWFIDFFACTA